MVMDSTIIVGNDGDERQTGRSSKSLKSNEEGKHRMYTLNRECNEILLWML